MAELQIACLGDFQVTLAGAVLTSFQTDKSRALLAYLALERHEHPRTKLAQFLWPGYSEESARNSLRQVLYQLRQLLQDKEATAVGLPPWLLLTRQTVQLNPDAPINVDGLTFRHLLAACASHAHADLLTCATCLARMRQAVDLYRGDFLAGFTVADSAPFEEWRRITQEQFHIQMLNALTQLAAAAEVAGDDEQAIQTAHRLLTLEPWLEAAHRQIMRLLAQRGQRAAALAQYQRCRQVLAEELGVEPDDETTALYEQIRNSQLQTQRVTPPVIALPPLDQPAAPVKPAAWLDQLPPLVGRANELTQITTLLGQPTCHLVTLVGPPGVGKTRLAQAVLAGSQFEHGSYFIELATLHDPTLLATTIAHALNTAHPTAQFTGERLIERLYDQALLLVLDNFEQVLPGVTLVGDLLAHCPQIKLVITSRAPLHLSGEQVITVHPLPVPDLAQPIDLATVARNEAVQLFCQRAAAVVPSFALTERLTPIVVEICRRLDGLPLAIELAAAHSRLLPPPALLERLTQRLALLTSRSQSRPERQQTLRAAIAWSYELLDAEEQRLFRQLTVFAGGATLSAIEAVIDSGQGTHALLAGLETLLDKSLLRQSELLPTQDEGERRVLMLETLREYGWELLTTAEAKEPVTQKRHAAYFLNLAETTAPKLHGPDQVVWLDRLALDHDNLRAALAWFVQANEVHKALRLATALRYFWRVRGHYREGCERLLHILARPEAAPTGGPTDAVRARALNAAGYLQWVQGNTTAAQTLLQEALTLGRAIADAEATAFALRYLGLAADERQEQATARQWLEESLAIYRTLDTANETALALMYLGDVAFSQQAYAEAQQLYQESAELLRRLGNNVVLPYALRHLGYLALARGDRRAALRLSTESLQLNLAAGEQQGSAAAVTALAAVAAAGERWEQAAQLLASVTAWLSASGVQLLPLDRTYYEQTQRLLEQHPQQITHATPPTAAERLPLQQALAYVRQELTFDEAPGRQDDKVTSTSSVTQSPNHPVTLSSSHPITQSPNHPVTLSPGHSLSPSPAPPHNLPAASTAFIGRTRSLAEIVSQLQTARLLTLVGPGGMGKTRLAVEVGRERLVAFTDGVWFVPLAAISTPAALAEAIATALGPAFQSSDPRSALLQGLRSKHLLLILDNFEQILPTDAEGTSSTLDLVSDLLEAAPRVQMLITSRQRLNLRSEQIYLVPALSFATNATLAEAMALASVRLFIQAMQRGQPNFQLTEENLTAVLRICQLVQGIPLGLELAAANALGAPLSAIADAIAQSSEFLAVEWRDLPERQRSMRAVFAWSWRLLSAAEQHILRQSAIFRGGFTYSAAQAVTGATIPLLKNLIDKSLLQWHATTTGEGSYALHELLRQFAAEELAATGEEQAVATRHSEYYLALLAAQQQSLIYHAPRQAIHALRAELDNIRQAWRWGAGHLSAPLVEQSALTLREFCLLTGLITEGVELFTLAVQARRHHGLERQPLSTTGEQQSEARVYSLLLGLLGNVLIMAGRHEEALQQASAALQFAADATNPEGAALAYLTQGQALRRQGKSAQAQQLLAQVVQLAQAAHDRADNPTLLLDLERRAYSWLTSIALSSDDYPLARTYISRQLELCRRLQKFAGEAMTLTDLVDIEKTLGNYALAQQYAEQALTAARKADYRWGEAACLEHLADLARFQGDYHQAQTLYAQALTLYHEMGHLLAEAVTTDKLGQLHLRFGAVDRARTHIGQAVHLLRSLDMPARETCAATLSRAWLSYLSDKPEAALVDAEQGWQMARQLDGGASQAAALILIALIRERLQQADEAATAYQAALTIYLALGHHHQTVEPRAGLARLALAAGDCARATAEVEAILPILQKQPRAGANNPFLTYFTCYRVLAAQRDARGAPLLQQGYTLLQQEAAQLDEESRQHFLTGIAVHRDLVAAYNTLQTSIEKPQNQADRAVASPGRSSLPLFVTPLVGRTQAIAEIDSQLQRPEVRLITLLGPGGMGKTRLAIEVGREQIGAFVDGVWFVALAPISNASALPAAIATTLEIALQGDDPRGLLLQLLRPKRLLLILDNFEHLLAEDSAGAGDALDLVVDLLNAAPGVQMLVTSRERLKLRGEQVYPVQALPFVERATLAEAVTSPAVRLFVDTVQRLQADFQLTATNLPAVLRICQLVQGMPLGLELAAANASSAPLRAIADALEQSAEILAVKWRDLPARQRSMRAVFAWSWQLLSAAEQRVLRQCALFRDGFDYTAAQTVIGATPRQLTALVDKSLLQWQAAAPGEGRYAMHELLRQFAAEALAESGERTLVEERHGRYYLAYLAARGFRLGRGEPKEAGAEIQVELENVRLAWHWAVTQDGLAELDQALYAWWQFCLLQGLGEEARQSLAAAVAGVRAQLTHRANDAALGLLGTRLLAKLLALHANFLFAQGHDEEMATQAREAMQLGAASGGFEGEILGAYVLGRVLQDAEQKREAQTLWQHALQLIQRYQPQQPENELLHEIHWMTHEMLRGSALHFGDYAGCRAHIVEALRICQMLGKQRGELSSLSCLAEINFFLYDFAAAEADYRAELALGRSLGYRQSEMSAQEGLARVARLRGDYATARTLFEQSLSTATELAFHYDEAFFLAALIRLHCQLGDQTAATAGLARLTQLLAQVKLGKECQLYGCLAAAIKAHYAGDKDEALAAAEEADRINQQGGDILFRLVDTALVLGHVRAAVGQWQMAQSAFQEALAAFQQFNNQALAAEPQAGLAQIALAQGDLAGAQTQIEAILPVLANEPHVGYNDPYFIYLTAYRVLAANHDPRAVALLQQGYALLQQDAAALDEASRQRFLTSVPLHRDLVAAYTEMLLQGDKVTSTSSVTLSALYDWAEMPVVDFFVERTAEMAQLTEWLTPRLDTGSPTTGSAPARLVSLLGMGGMGKTTLAAAVTKAVAPHFAVVIWRSLLNAPPVAELLRNWLQILSRQTLTAPPDALDDQLRLLLTYLQQERCLLVLDNVESIFAADGPGPTGTPQSQSRAGVTRPGYEGYDQLFQRLATSDHQSCLLLTSREQPYALLRSGRQAQAAGRIQVLTLTGLDEQAGQMLLQNNGLHTSTAEAAQLVENYSGNPLALQIVAATIADFFGGDVVAFQQEEGQFFDGLRLVLDQQFARLSSLERDILIWLAIEREPITVPTLRNNFVQSVPTNELLEALQALQNRSLLEKRDTGLTLQNVIIEYTTAYLVEQICQESLDDKVTSTSSVTPYSSHPITQSFLNRFALLKAQAKEYVRQSQARLLLRPVAERLVATVGRSQLLARIPQLLDALRIAGVQKGYAGGNLLNLLVQLGEELIGYDFSHLPVWQADLSGLTFVNADFTGADLRGATFTAGITVDVVAFQPTGELWAAGIRNGRLGLWRMIERQLTDAFQSGDNLRRPLVFSPQGEFLVTSTDDNRINIWSTNSGACLQTLTKQSSSIHALAFSRDGAYLASFSADLVICLWDLQSGRCVQQLQGYKLGADALAFSPDGQLLATGGGDGLIQLWDTNSRTEAGRRVAAWQAHHGPLGALAFSADGCWLASGSHAGELRLWQVASITTEQRQQGAGNDVSAPPYSSGPICQGHTGIIRALLFLPTGDPATYLLASASDDRTVRIWSLTGQLRYTLLGHTNAVLSLSASPDGRHLASAGADKQIFLWDVESGQALYLQQAYRMALQCLAFSPDGQMLASGGADHIVRLWQVDGDGMGQLRHTLRGHRHFIDSVAFSPDGQTIASGDADCTIRLWDRATGQALQTLRKHQGTVRALAFAPTSSLVAQKETLLASAGTDRIIRLWSVGASPRREARYQRQLIGHEADILALAFDQHGHHLVSGCADGTLRIWDVQSGVTIHRLSGHTAPVTAVVINLDDHTVASNSFDLTIRLWDLTTGACLHIERDGKIGPNGVVFSHDGQYLAYTGNDLGLYLWSWRTYAAEQPLPHVPLWGHRSTAYALCFRPTAPHLASCTIDGRLHLWDLVNRRCTQVLRPPGPYAGMNITGVTGISEAQKAALCALGAVEE